MGGANFLNNFFISIAQNRRAVYGKQEQIPAEWRWETAG